MDILSSIEPYLAGEIDPAFAARARLILAAVARHQPARLLDAGCGRGYYLRMASLLSGHSMIVGTDRDTRNVRRARRVARERPNVQVYRGDVARLPFADGAFDFVICSEVLEHLPDDDGALVELSRVLAPGGTLAVSVPCRDFPLSWDPVNWILMRLSGRHVPARWHWLAGIWADHERLYTAIALEKLVGRHFTVGATHGVVRRSWPFAHLLFYGLGKNLVDRLGWTMFDRFEPGPPGRARRWLGWLCALPSGTAGMVPAGAAAVNLVVFARK